MNATYELDRGLTLQRIFNAPPDLVFEAWTDPAYLDWFFNPDNLDKLTTHPVSVDLRVGGQWRQQMVISPDNQYFTGGVYREIVPGKKLVFHWGAVGGWPELDLENLDASPLVTIHLAPRGEQTVMDFHVQFPDHMTEERVDWWLACGMVEGWNMTIDRLVAVYQGAERQASSR